MHNAETLLKIRENERHSHQQMYTSNVLYHDKGWLQKPVKTVLDLLPRFYSAAKLRFLDLGCGVGRNSIRIAEYFSGRDCTVDCIDILDIAISQLKQYAKEYSVSSLIRGTVSPIEDYTIPSQYYNGIFAISALEHLESEEIFRTKLEEIRDGLCDGGVACLIINSDITERNSERGTDEPPQFELLFSCEELDALLLQTFSHWTILKHTHQLQHYQIPRSEAIHELSTTVVTFVAQKPDM